MLFSLYALAVLVLQASAYTANLTTSNLTPWTELGISVEDAANFAAWGMTPQEGFQIIEAERALFNGTPAHKVPGAISASSKMGTMGTMGTMGMTDASDSANPKVIITLGWRRQHVGFTWNRDGTYTYDLAGNLLLALNTLCGGNRNDEPVCNYSPAQIRGIYYNVGKNAYVDVSVESFNLPRLVKDLMIRTVWAVFKEITECESSRYQLRNFGKHHEACREFANSADYIDVRIENFRGPDNKLGQYEQPHLRIRIKFNGDTTEGPFDCVGTQSLIWDKVRSRMVPRFSKAFENSPVDFDVICPTSHKDGGCNDEHGHQVICRDDPRWDNKDGSCTWHDKCDTPWNCDHYLDF